MAFERKNPATNHAPGDRSGTSSAESRDSARQSGAPEHRGPRKADGTLGSSATMKRGATHPDRTTDGEGALSMRGGDAVPEGDAAAPDDVAARPTRDDVHEQRSEAQPREGVLPKPRR